MEKIDKLLQYTIIAITILITIIIITTYIGIINSILLTFLIFILLYLFNKKINEISIPSRKNDSIKSNIILSIILFVFSFAIRIFLLKLLDIMPESDFALLFKSSKQLSVGINELNNSSYFLTWAYQTGYVLYQAIILKIFNNTFSLSVLNCIYASISCVFIYLISNKIFKNKLSSFLASLLYCIGFFASAYCGVLTNQHLFSILILISIYLLVNNIDNISLKNSITIAIILSFANIIRPEVIVYLLAIIIFMVLNIKNKNDIKKYLTNILSILIIYLIIFQSASFIIQKTKINQNGLSNNNTLWKFVCGLDYSSMGQYSKNGELVFNDHDKEIEYIKNNLKMPLNNYLKLFYSKISLFWHHNDYNWVLQNNQINLFNKNLDNTELTKIFSFYDSIIYLFILLFLLVFLINIIFKKEIKKEVILLMLMIIINFFVYLIIEVQPRYSYTIKILLYILSSGGISYIINLLHVIGKVKDYENGKNN